MFEEVTKSGFQDLFNTIIAEFHRHGDLEKIEEVFLQGFPYSNNWIQRLKMAINYARIIAFTHNSDFEKNPFNSPLVQKDRKISQFLV